MVEDMNFQTNYIEGVNKFQGLRAKAFLQEMMGLLRGQSAELLSFEEVRARLRLHEESYKGLQDIPLSKIVGSVGRHRDFTKHFFPKNNDMRERWGRVYAKVNSQEGVPPIEVYQVGDIYFVRDGNHRVSVAQELDMETIQAHVTELPTSALLEEGMTLEDLDAAAVYISFLEETGLKRNRPHHTSMQLRDPSGYAELLGHIYLHGQVMETLRGEPVRTEEAAANWYDFIYRPAITLIRKHNVLELTGEDKNKHSETSLYIWMVNHLRDLRRHYESEEAVKFSDALVDYLAEKKISIPSDLILEDDATVLLTKTQAIKKVQDERNAS